MSNFTNKAQFRSLIAKRNKCHLYRRFIIAHKWAHRGLGKTKFSDSWFSQSWEKNQVIIHRNRTTVDSFNDSVFVEFQGSFWWLFKWNKSGFLPSTHSKMQQNNHFTYISSRRRLPRTPLTTGVLKCSGWVRGNWSKVSLSAKWRPLFKQRAVRLRVAISPSSKTVK